jgi:hypothetical protein
MDGYAMSTPKSRRNTRGHDDLCWFRPPKSKPLRPVLSGGCIAVRKSSDAHEGGPRLPYIVWQARLQGRWTEIPISYKETYLYGLQVLSRNIQTDC